MAGIQEWYYSVPPVTRYWMTAIFALACTSTMGFTGFGDIGYFVTSLKAFKLWTPITGLLFLGSFGINFAITLLMLVQFSQKLEPQFGRTVDYLWTVMMGGLFLVLISTVYQLLVFNGYISGDQLWIMMSAMMAKSLIYFIVWIYCRRNANQNFNIMGLLQVPAPAYPLAITFVDLIMGIPIILNIVGSIVGHLFIVSVDMAESPNFLQKIFTPPAWFVQRFDPGFAHVRRHQNVFGGHSWGSGQRLGN